MVSSITFLTFARVTPFLYFAISKAFAFGALLAPQYLRPALCFPILLFGVKGFNGIPQITSNTDHASVLGFYSLFWLLHIFNVLLIQRQAVAGQNRRQKWHSAYKWMTRGRWPATPPDIRRLNSKASTTAKSSTDILLYRIASLFVGSSFNATKDREVDRQIERYVFVIRQIILCTTIYTVHYLYQTYIVLTPYPTLFDSLSIDDFYPTYHTYARRLLFPHQFHPSVTIRESMLRAVLVMHFVWTTYSTLTFLHTAFSILFVGVLHLDEPEEWPQQYGSLSCTYTLRGFWKGFWHRLVYRTWISYGSLFLRCVRVPARSVAGGILMAAFVFFANGMLHAAVDWRIGLCGYEGAVVWFVLNFCAMMIEDAALKMANMTLSERLKQWSGWKVLGYVWVWGFLFWSLPKDHYTKVWCLIAAE